ncbi:MAG: GNAT family N-acetyltransferase [Acidimicrobiia bacterium]
MIDDRLQQFLDTFSEETGFPALSEAKELSLANPDLSVVIAEDDQIVAVGAAAKHDHGDGSAHHAIETAVIPSMQFPAFEEMVAAQALAMVPAGPVSFWSQRSTLDTALDALGFRETRTLVHMIVDLPLGEQAVGFRSLAADEHTSLIAINNAAFSAHREAANLTMADFEALAAQPWFDRTGIIVATDDDGVIGFCWTKVHPGGDGEIYRIAVDPGAQGQGIGHQLVLAGFDYLNTERGANTGTLWVEEDNLAAMKLYEAIGMRQDRRNREFLRGG